MPTRAHRYAAQVEHFERMRDLAMILNRKRERRGSIDFDLPEPVIEFDEFGLMKSITRSERNIAHRLIEEFMLSANECVAHYLENKRIASLYRIHEKPDAKRVYDFEVIAATFGYSLGVGALPIQRVQMKADRRAAHGTGKRAREIEVPKEVHITPRMYQKLTDENRRQAGRANSELPDAALAEAGALLRRKCRPLRAGRDDLHALHFADPPLSRPDRPPHLEGSPAGLARKDGRRDSSRHTAARTPQMRVRVAPQRQRRRVRRRSSARAGRGATPSPWSKRRDHDAHQQSLEPLGGPISLEELHAIAEESSHSERRADDAERELMEWKKVKFMEPRIGEDFDGLIISVTKFGFFVELTDLFVEGLVPLQTLGRSR